MRRMYSENQLKEVVNKAIQSGEIEVGKKIYQHLLELTDGAQIYIYNNSNEKIDTLDGLDLMDSAVSLFPPMIYIDSVGVSVPILHYESYVVAYSNGSSSIQSKDLTDYIDDVNDTITAIN